MAGYAGASDNVVRGEGMFSAMLLTISVVALSQFAVYYWRAVVAGVAAQPISDEVLAAARVETPALSGQDFPAIAKLHDLTPNLQRTPSGLGLVRMYFHAMRGIATIANGRLAAVAAWAERECELCTRYAAVQVDRRLQANLAMAATMRSC